MLFTGVQPWSSRIRRFLLLFIALHDSLQLVTKRANLSRLSFLFLTVLSQVKARNNDKLTFHRIMSLLSFQIANSALEASIEVVLFFSRCYPAPCFHLCCPPLYRRILNLNYFQSHLQCVATGLMTLPLQLLILLFLSVFRSTVPS